MVVESQKNLVNMCRLTMDLIKNGIAYNAMKSAIGGKFIVEWTCSFLSREVI